MPTVTASSNPESQPQGRLAEVARLFLRLGVTAFGGPAAHIAMMQDEVVHRRKWVSQQHFLDLLGATNLIPGPNSTEMAIHLGFIRAGWRGLLAAGALFILPAMVIVIAFAWAYVEYGSTPEVTWLLYGIKPVVIAVVAQALWRLGRAALSTPFLGAVGASVVGLYLLGLNEIALLFGAGFSVMAVRLARLRVIRPRSLGALLPIAGLPLPLAATAAVEGYSHTTLFLTFLKIGSVLYGSGYVLLAFLRNDFVERLGWLTNQQLLDAVAVGQFTPGPVFTTATFIGYILGGFPGAILATVGIFLPAFVFVAALNPLVPRIRRSPWLSALLDGVNVAAVGLMAAVLVVLTRDAIVDWYTVLLTAVAAALLLRWNVNSAWLVAAGGVAGIAYQAFA
ncbi:MAG: chromate efflux transporter [Dehalococcoidia bacterium]|nr:chromate efflux transporter [Dehalococcoidia bacterium]